MSAALTSELAIAITLLRYGAQLLWPARGARVPRAILLVNVVGSAIGGATLALVLVDTGAGVPAISSSLALVVMTGFCGGLTTFSTFAVETVELASGGSWRPAVANVVLNVVLGLGAAALAFAVTNGVIIVTTGAFVG